jgi:hypothetical protein
VLSFYTPWSGFLERRLVSTLLFCWKGGTVTDLSQVLEEIRAKIARHGEDGLNEEDTKTALINPVLCALGWPVGDLTSVKQEYRRSPGDNPVDYALLVLAAPRLFVEAKALKQELDDHKWCHEIAIYAVEAGVKWAIVTNGDEYRIYNLAAPVPFAEKLFHKMRVTDPQSPVAETLALFSKERVDRLEAEWESHYADRCVRAALDRLLAPPASAGLVALIQEHVQNVSVEQIQESLRRIHAGQSPGAQPAGKAPPNPGAGGSEHHKVSLKDLVDKDVGVLKPPVQLTSSYKGHELQAQLCEDGAIVFREKKFWKATPAAHSAQIAATGQEAPVDGWKFWRYQDENGVFHLLEVAKELFLKKQATRRTLSG